ncbi:hypothetical protein Pst134EB_016583 [Puccinia striiformis f. sp. tritici]|nr:hypothetical protein Pst134EB_016583 [Puccinia striiformis f. sp. tritici]
MDDAFCFIFKSVESGNLCPDVGKKDGCLQPQGADRNWAVLVKLTTTASGAILVRATLGPCLMVRKPAWLPVAEERQKEFQIASFVSFYESAQSDAQSFPKFALHSFS